MVIRLLSLNYEFPPIGGGGGNAHHHILQELQHEPDLDITVMVPTTEPEPRLDEWSPRLRIHYRPIQKKDRLFWRRGEVIRYLVDQFFFLRTHLATHSYDVCHAFFGFPTGVLAWWNRDRFPYIVSVRGSDVPGYNQRFSLDYRMLSPLLTRVYGSAFRVVANSQGLRDLYERQFPGSHAPVISNGIDTDRYRPVSAEAKEPCSIVTVARLIPRKGIHLLLEACQRLKSESCPFHCHIVGEGPERMLLEAQARDCGIAERVTFHGDMPRETIVSFLPTKSVFVLPSFAEGMSNAALEAMACGLPVLLTETGGSHELVDGNGAIVPCGDVDALARVLSDWMRDPESVVTMGQESRRRAEALSWSRVAGQYASLYREAVAR